jgi:hypothetical protein
MGSNHTAAEIVKGSPIKISIELQDVGKTPALDEISVNHLTNHPIKTPLQNFDDCSKNDASQPVTLMPNATSEVKASGVTQNRPMRVTSKPANENKNLGR